MIIRRDWLHSALSAAISFFASAVKAQRASGLLTVDEYLKRAAIMVDLHHRLLEYVAANSSDLNVANLASDLAENFAAVASKTIAPSSLRSAHLSLWMAIEHAHGAYQAILRGDSRRIVQRFSSARKEEQAFRQALDTAKVKLPSVN